MKPIVRIRRIMLLPGILALLATGCNFFEIFKSDKKTVRREIDRIKAAVNRDDWKTIQSMLTDDFVWITSDGTTIKNYAKGGKVIRHGSKYFQESIDALPANRVAFIMTVHEVDKVTDTKFFAKVESRLKIRTGTADTDNIMWESMYTWVKKGNKMLLAEVKDLALKKSTRGRNYDTNPKISPTKKKKKRR